MFFKKQSKFFRNKSMTFVDKCLVGMCLNTIEKLDDEIKLWSRSSTDITLQDWLGLTNEEFEQLQSTEKYEQSQCFKEILINRVLDK